VPLGIVILSGRPVRLMTPNDASRGGAQDAVVSRIVPGNAAHQSTLYAPFGIRHSRQTGNYERDCSASNN
jgi:hypothetical protein